MEDVLCEWFPRDIAQYIVHLMYYQEWRKRIDIVNDKYKRICKFDTKDYVTKNSNPLFVWKWVGQRCHVGCVSSPCSHRGTYKPWNHRTSIAREIMNIKGKYVASLPNRYWYSNGDDCLHDSFFDGFYLY